MEGVRFKNSTTQGFTNQNDIFKKAVDKKPTYIEHRGKIIVVEDSRDPPGKVDFVGPHLKGSLDRAFKIKEPYSYKKEI